MTTPTQLSHLYYPITTPEAEAFWSSEHKCNTAKAYCAFSPTAAQCNELLKKAGYTAEWRKRVLLAFGQYINDPEMLTIPLSDTDDLYWEEMGIPADLSAFHLTDIIDVLDAP
ncbi:hypothetical protein RGQ13_08725 [Thalassotalea psychrophila]|uniref:Uncharacterized protein n=1 Tax=Thalassotalea psychrophila TaxID=3065647 RepID=A0ABY9TZ06_9GAMM|nr:hypothetical protein RGQ13_08725 [Colwelliaceae bacterium SQ149]